MSSFLFFFLYILVSRTLLFFISSPYLYILSSSLSFCRIHFSPTFPSCFEGCIRIVFFFRFKAVNVFEIIADVNLCHLTLSVDPVFSSSLSSSLSSTSSFVPSLSFSSFLLLNPVCSFPFLVYPLPLSYLLLLLFLLFLLLLLLLHLLRKKGTYHQRKQQLPKQFQNRFNKCLKTVTATSNHHSFHYFRLKIVFPGMVSRSIHNISSFNSFSLFIQYAQIVTQPWDTTCVLLQQKYFPTPCCVKIFYTIYFQLILFSPFLPANCDLVVGKLKEGSSLLSVFLSQ